MAYIKEYWEDKKERAKIAKEHAEEMEEKYDTNINYAVDGTKIYDIDFQFTEKETEIIVEDLDTVHAACTHHEYEKVVALLNFASYKNPGGMFLEGSKAQEECLCHSSFLYNVLKEFKDDFYDWNNKNKNKALYLNRGLYSPDILFDYEGIDFYCDVITCAAPNKSAAQKYQNVADKENTKVLKDRIRFVLDIAKDNNVDILILGAYGCGVFGQDATEVATIFKEFLETTHKNCFNKVVFAIPKSKEGNYEAFKRIFS